MAVRARTQKRGPAFQRDLFLMSYSSRILALVRDRDGDNGADRGCAGGKSELILDLPKVFNQERAGAYRKRERPGFGLIAAHGGIGEIL